MYAFDTVQIQLLAAPGDDSHGVRRRASHIARIGATRCSSAPPPSVTTSPGIRVRVAFRGRKVFGAMYSPWIQIVNPLDTTGANPLI